MQEEGRHWPPADELLVSFFSLVFEAHVPKLTRPQDHHHPRLQRIAPSTMDLRVRTPMRRNLGDSVNISLTKLRCSNHWMKNFKAVHDRQQTIWIENKVWVKLCMLQKGPVLCGYWEVEKMII